MKSIDDWKKFKNNYFLPNIDMKVLVNFDLLLQKHNKNISKQVKLIKPNSIAIVIIIVLLS